MFLSIFAMVSGSIFALYSCNDEDLYAKAPDGSIYKLPAGVYCMDKSIGKLGGYKLPLQIVKNMNYEQ